MPLQKLKVVKLEGFKNTEDLMFFKDRLMDVFYVQPYAIEVRHGKPARYRIQIPNESNPSKFSRKFFKECENNISLCY